MAVNVFMNIDEISGDSTTVKPDATERDALVRHVDGMLAAASEVESSERQASDAAPVPIPYPNIAEFQDSNDANAASDVGSYNEIIMYDTKDIESSPDAHGQKNHEISHSIHYGTSGHIDILDLMVWESSLFG